MEFQTPINLLGSISACKYWTQQHLGWEGGNDGAQLQKGGQGHPFYTTHKRTPCVNLQESTYYVQRSCLKNKIIQYEERRIFTSSDDDCDITKSFHSQ